MERSQYGVRACRVMIMAEPLPPATGPPQAMATTARGEGALSPLSGSYLLIVVSEPQTDQHKDIILSKVAKGKILYHI